MGVVAGVHSSRAVQIRLIGNRVSDIFHSVQREPFFLPLRSSPSEIQSQEACRRFYRH